MRVSEILLTTFKSALYKFRVSNFHPVYLLPPDVPLINHLANSMQCVMFHPGKCVCRQGEVGEHFF